MRPTPATIAPLLLILLGASPRGSFAAETDNGALFTQLDANADGQLAAEEVGEEHRLLFKRLVRTGDDDGDGRLSPDEFTAALQPVRAEKGTIEKQGSRLPGADALLVVLAKMDANGDRQLDPKEIPADYQRLFQQMLGPADDDKNGRLDRREIAKGAPRIGMIAQMGAKRMGLDVAAELEQLPEESMNSMEQMEAYLRPGKMLADPAQAEQLFLRLDANGDKQLAADEVEGPFAQRFAQMVKRNDRNGDKQLSKGEFLAAARRATEFENRKPDAAAAKRTMRQWLNRFDKDGDGALSVREAPPRVAENFDRADTDANGKLDRAELTRIAELTPRMPPSAENRNAFGSPAMDGESEPAPPAKQNKAGQQRLKKPANS